MFQSVHVTRTAPGTRWAPPRRKTSRCSPSGTWRASSCRRLDLLRFSSQPSPGSSQPLTVSGALGGEERPGQEMPGGARGGWSGPPVMMTLISETRGQTLGSRGAASGSGERLLWSLIGNDFYKHLVIRVLEEGDSSRHDQRHNRQSVYLLKVSVVYFEIIWLF